MRKWMLIGLLAGLAAVTGCATVTKTAEESRATATQVWNFELRAMGHDWNVFWMTNRPTRLTEWQTR